MRCGGLHCDGCRHGGGPAGAGAAVVVLLLFIAVGLRKAGSQVASALEIIGWTLAGIAGAVIVVTGAVLTVRVTRAAGTRRSGQQAALNLCRPGYRIIPGKAAGYPAIGRPAWLYGTGCCEHWTSEHGCSAGHTGRPAMSLDARAAWPGGRRGLR